MMAGGITAQALESALRGLDARREAHETNVANVETPGYKARSVQFEGALKRAIAGGAAVVDPSVAVSAAPGRPNGNNVNIADELIGLTETALTQELLIRALNDRFGLIRTAVGGG